VFPYSVSHKTRDGTEKSSRAASKTGVNGKYRPAKFEQQADNLSLPDTEFGAVFRVEGSVGSVVAGTSIKLSDGDEGELFVNGPFMFLKYVMNLQIAGYYQVWGIQNLHP
jgi:hypothetical protein